MKVAVTGGAGFIGSWTVDKLIEYGYTPIIFDHRGRSHRDDVEIIMGNVRDEVAMTELAARVDGIIHLAGVLGTQETIKNPRPALLSNIEGGLNFLEAITQYDLPGTYIGVGNHWMQNAYSISKTTVERLSHMYRNERGTKINQVRCVNAYGPRQGVAAPFGSSKVRKIMPAFICRALTNQPIEIYGDGEQVSDCVYVEDVAECLVRSFVYASNGNLFDHVIEIGPEEHITVNDIAALVAELVNEIQPGLFTAGISHLPMRPGEEPGAKVMANISTLLSVDMNADNLMCLRDGIYRTIQWYDETKGITWNAPQS